MKEKIFNQIITPLWAQATGPGFDGLFRNAVTKAVQNGRKIFKSVFQRTERSDVTKEVPQVFAPPVRVNVSKPSFERVIFDGLFPKVSVRSVAAELRRRAAWQGVSASVRQFGKNGRAPLLCFIGVGFAANERSSTSTTDHNIFANIRDLVQKFNTKETVEETGSSNRLEDLVFGSFIEKGCNAAVYEARYVEREENVTSQKADMKDFLESHHGVVPSTTETIEVSKQFEESINDLNSEEPDDISILSMVSDDDDDDYLMINKDAIEFNYFQHTKDKECEGLYLVIDDGGSDIVVLDVDEEDFELLDEENPEIDKAEDKLVNLKGEGQCCEEKVDKFDLAVKMMFNYDAESNTVSISQAMKRETIPAKGSTTHDSDTMNIIRSDSNVYLPPHPNIVDMKDVFIDNVPKLEDSTVKYPAALPKRLHDDGLGRNMTMFLVMKRYTSTLREYLLTNDIDMTTRLLLLTQLLEGIEHLSFHSIAHRDIKSNNILIDTDTADGKPHLVISDFGCCLADYENGLKIPYVSTDQTKGGNPSLMAPEIVNAVPSVYGKSILDYSKSDLWAAGSLAYEIFGEENPFYGKNHGITLNSGTYRMSDLPPLPDSVPEIVQDLVYNMLEIDLKKRLTASTAATVLQVYLWNNDYFHFNQESMKSDLKLFILMLTLEVISKKLYNSDKNLETELKLSLLKRMTERDLNNCVEFYVKYIK